MVEWVSSTEALAALEAKLGVETVLHMSNASILEGLTELGYAPIGNGLFSHTVEVYTSATGGAEVANVIYTAEGVTPGAVDAAVNAVGVQVPVAAKFVGGAIAAALGLQIGKKINEVNPKFWDDFVGEIIDFTCTGDLVNLVYTTSESVWKALLPASLVNHMKDWLIEKGAYIPPVFNPPEIDTEFTDKTYPKTLYGADDDVNIQLGRIMVDHPEISPDDTMIFCTRNPTILASPVRYEYTFIENASPSRIEAYKTEPQGETSARVRFAEPKQFASATFEYGLPSTIYNWQSGVNHLDMWEYTSQYPIQTFANLGSVDYAVPGVSVKPGAVIPSAVEDVTETYPSWVPIDIGDTSFLPIGIVTTDPEYDPAVNPYDQTQEEAQTGTQTDPQTIIDNIANGGTPTPPPPISDGETGSAPAIITGTTSGLFRIWNPTLTELQQFGSWLWSTDPVKILTEIFSNNPVDGIIGLHLIFGTPTTGGTDAIKVGYVQSPVTSKWVSDQYIHIDCGSVTVPEYSGNATDYAPFTHVECYLPFIGIVTLNANDIIGANTNIKYTIDVLTGSVLAQIIVKKAAFSGVLYSFAGSCAVQLPVTGASRASQMLGTVLGAVAGFTTGGPAGAAIGGITGATRGAAISSMGSFTGNAGAMGIRKPYFIINSAISYDAPAFNGFYGYPSNNTVKLGSCSGFTRVRSVHVEDIPATGNELDMIDAALKAGVII